MKIFSGFPAGKLEVTPLPNLFFSELLPAIDDLAELKVTLHLFWLLARRKTPYVRASELRADRTLIQSLSIVNTTLDDALARAVARGTLLEWNAQDDALYFLNNERGRRALEKIEEEHPPRSNLAPEPATSQERPNIFALYEQNIGLLTPLIVEELKEAEREYPSEWIAEAIRLAVEHNKRNWRYARAILERWKTEGRDTGKKKKTWYDDAYAKFVKR
ncbi:MAG: DnaD domain protein [Anaerolineae bacterium]|nr:DnaD domain protein [Anaerolineae bacterium]